MLVSLTMRVAATESDFAELLAESQIRVGDGGVVHSIGYPLAALASRPRRIRNDQFVLLKFSEVDTDRGRCHIEPVHDRLPRAAGVCTKPRDDLRLRDVANVVQCARHPFAFGGAYEFRHVFILPGRKRTLHLASGELAYSHSK